jgi:hypothetical protein
MNYYFPYGYPPGYNPAEELPSHAHVIHNKDPPPGTPKAIRITGLDGTPKTEVRLLLNKVQRLESENLELETQNKFLNEQAQKLLKMVEDVQGHVREMEVRQKVLESELKKAKRGKDKIGGKSKGAGVEEAVVVIKEEEAELKIKGASDGENAIITKKEATVTQVSATAMKKSVALTAKKAAIGEKLAIATAKEVVEPTKTKWRGAVEKSSGDTSGESEAAVIEKKAVDSKKKKMSDNEIVWDNDGNCNDKAVVTKVKSVGSESTKRKASDDGYS